METPELEIGTELSATERLAQAESDIERLAQAVLKLNEAVAAVNNQQKELLALLSRIFNKLEHH